MLQKLHFVSVFLVGLCANFLTSFIFVKLKIVGRRSNTLAKKDLAKVLSW